MFQAGRTINIYSDITIHPDITTAGGNITLLAGVQHGDFLPGRWALASNPTGGNPILGEGWISIDHVADLATNGGNVTLRAGNDITFLNQSAIRTGSGDVTLEAGNNLRIIGSSTIDTGNGNFTATSNEIDISATIRGTGTATLQPFSTTQDIVVAGSSNTATLDLTTAELNSLQDGFAQIVIGRSDSTGLVALNSSFAFQDPVHIAGGSTLIGPSQNTTWTVTGTGRGNLSGFNESLTFANIEHLTGRSAGDSFILNGGSIDSVDGGNGIDNSLTGDNSANTWNITADNAGYVNGVGAFSNIQNLVGGSEADSFNVNGGSVAEINGGDGNNSLTGDNSANAWTIDGADTGQLNGSNRVSSIQNLTGGNDGDTFSFSGDDARISHSIDGAGGSDTLDYAGSGSDVTLTLGTNDPNQPATALSNIEFIRGNGKSTTLMGSDADSTWKLNDRNGGEVNGTHFSGI